MSDLDDLRARVLALECEAMAYSALFQGLLQTLGPQFFEAATRIAELTEAHPQVPSAVSQRMTEALRVIDQIRHSGDRKPKPGAVV